MLGTVTSLLNLLRSCSYIQGMYQSLRGRYVPVKGGQCQVWTISLNEQPHDAKVDPKLQCSYGHAPNNRIPLVLVHGFAGGVGLWAQNLDSLSKDRSLFAFDLLGFGKSSRPVFSRDPEMVDIEWVQSVEDWRKAMNLEKVILLGHSLGAYVATAYAIEYPNRVRHLPTEHIGQQQLVLPSWARAVATIASYFNPLSSLRMAGPFGPQLVRKMRPDLRAKFVGAGEDDDAIFDYIYHCNAQFPSGEVAFKTLSVPFGWAKRPMIERIEQLHADVPISFIYGSRSWIESGPGYRIQHELRPNSYVAVEMIRGAGHHLYADKPDEFNGLVKKICESVDRNHDILESESDD